jgi:hypothetical protein
MNPRLPKMAQLLVVYALVAYPLYWVFNSISALVTYEPAATKSGALMDGLGCISIFLGLVVGVVLVFAGLRLRSLKPGSAMLYATTLVIYFGLSLILLAVGICVGFPAMADVAETEVSGGESQIFTVLATTMEFARFVFEVVGVIWLFSNRARLRALEV